LGRIIPQGARREDELHDVQSVLYAGKQYKRQRG
jgi:hypothetical protein